MRRRYARAQLKGRIAGLVGPKANLVEPKASFVGPKVTWFSENADYCSHTRGKIEVGRNLALTTNRSTGERHKIMSGRTLVLLSASALVDIACVVTVATDAFAQRRGGAAVARGGVHHGGVARAGVYRGGAGYRGVGYRGAPVARAAALGVGAAAVGAAATGYGLYGPYGYGQFSGARANYFGAPYSGWSDYASRNGLVCQPGTLWTGPDGLQHMCQ